MAINLTKGGRLELGKGLSKVGPDTSWTSRFQRKRLVLLRPFQPVNWKVLFRVPTAETPVTAIAPAAQLSALISGII